MANCEKCGKLIADGLVFCDDCSKDEIKTKEEVKLQTSDLLHDDHELFSFKRQHRSNIVLMMRIFPIVLGLLTIAIGILSLFPDIVDFTLPQNLLIILVTLLCILYIIRISRQSKLPMSLFLVLISLSLAFGGAAVFPENSSLIIVIGAIFSILVLTFSIFKNYKGKLIPLIALTVLFCSVGLGVVFPEHLVLILGVSLIVTGILLVLKF